MVRPPPVSTRTGTLFALTTLLRSLGAGLSAGRFAEICCGPLRYQDDLTRQRCADAPWRRCALYGRDAVVRSIQRFPGRDAQLYACRCHGRPRVQELDASTECGEPVRRPLLSGLFLLRLVRERRTAPGAGAAQLSVLTGSRDRQGRG